MLKAGSWHGMTQLRLLKRLQILFSDTPAVALHSAWALPQRESCRHRNLKSVFRPLYNLHVDNSDTDFSNTT